MGTSTNYAGSPNWESAKTETTRAGGEGHVTSQKAASIVSGFVGQMARSPQLGFGPRLSSGGGGGGASGNKTSGGGRGGARGGGRGGGSARSIGRGLGSFLSDVQRKGFREALAERGLTNLTGKTPDEIALALADILGGPASLIEQTALRDALITLVFDWSKEVSNLEELAQSVTGISQDIDGALRDFFAHYIFEVFKTVGYQGVLKTHGFEKAERMVQEIRDFIGAKISEVQTTRTLSSIDWNGAAGAATIDGIVADTIEIFAEGQS